MSRTYRSTEDHNPYQREKKEYRKEHYKQHRKKVKQHLHDGVLLDADIVDENMPQYSKTSGWLTW